MAYFYILTFPFFGFSLLNIGGRALLRPDWLVGGLLLIWFSLESLQRRARVPFNLTSILIGLYIASGILSGINVLGASSSAQFIDFTTKALQLLLVTPVFFVITSLPARMSVVRTCLRFWVFSGFVVSIHAIYQLFAQVFNLPFATFALTNPTISRGIQSARTLFGYTQPTSVFQEPSYMGAFLGPCLLLTTVFVLEQQSETFFFRRRYLNWWMLTTIALAVMLSNSQAILASIIITLLWVGGGGLLRRKQVVKLIVLVIGILFLVGIVLRTMGIDYLTAFAYRAQYLLLNIMDPYGSSEVTSFANRWERINAGVDVWRTHPLLGVGLGNMGYYTNVHDWSNSPWVQLLVEQGALGLFLLALVFTALFFHLFWCLHRLSTDSYWRSLLIAVLSLVVLTAVDGLFTLNWTHPQRIFTLAFANWIALQAQSVIVYQWHQQAQLLISSPRVSATSVST